MSRHASSRGRRHRSPPPTPTRRALPVLLDTLLAAHRPLIFAGGGLYNSPQALGLLVRFAELTQIPVITSWRHHDEFPNDHPLFLGCASLGTAPTVWERLAESDVMLVIGNRMQETSTAGYTYPLTSTRLLQVDIDPAAFVNHRSPELAVLADAGAALAALIERVPDPVPCHDERRVRNVADRRRFEDATAIPEVAPTGDGVPYAHVMQVLADTLSPETIITSDAGNFYGWLARYYRFRKERTYLGPASGAMGFGLSSAIGAKIARPGTPVVSVSGDGGFLMTAAELETAARYDVGVVALVLDNARQGTIRMHQEAQFPGRVIATELGVTDLAARRPRARRRQLPRTRRQRLRARPPVGAELGRGHPSSRSGWIAISSRCRSACRRPGTRRACGWPPLRTHCQHLS